ncbi:uncharacterized protein LOC129738640 isoform X2 [Uranotaenia lowii]|uniref:uncharacterized protein LOC129738640 isoform X2 n=1 Tax=Uranotaenia lowii TaxID=190385 RepID=UPI002479A7CA|nr:uncharacterized protein LOC129738640 isoform X2 [Uranotaenia lowii]
MKHLNINNLDSQQTVDVLGFEVDLTFKIDQPIFKKAYQVPYKLKEKFSVHLQGLEQKGIITPIKSSEWASPVIAILKKNDEIRMISIGTNVFTAHRHQLKMVHEPRRRWNVMVRTGIPRENERQGKRRRSSSEDEFLGFPDSQEPLAPPPKIRSVVLRSPIMTRSKRSRADILKE